MYKYEIIVDDMKQIKEVPLREVEKLALNLGIDFPGDRKYRWFLEQALTCLLPIDWNREKGPEGSI